MTFEKVPTQETLVKRAKKIDLCIDEGLKKLNQENKISFPDLEYGYEKKTILLCMGYRYRRLSKFLSKKIGRRHDDIIL